MSDKHLSRRGFIKAVGGLSAGTLFGARGAFGQQAPEGGGKPGEMREVPVRPFGKTGVKVSCLSLGGMFDIPSNQLLMKQALRWGVTYWDTADCYEGGKSESGIGQFFEKYPDTRSRIFLVTKSDERDPDGMSKLLARSLERMKTDYVDLYFIHALKRISEINNETRAWAEKAKSQGKIKFFGFSTHSNMEDCMLEAARLGWIDGIMMTYNYRIMNNDKMKRAVEACSKVGIGLTAMKTQAGGPFSMESEEESKMVETFVKQGFTDKQAKLKAVWENPSIASICSQMPNMTVFMANVAAALNETKLSAEGVELLNRYAEDTASSYCAGCTEICEAALGGGVPVGDVMRYLMYSRSYGESELARMLFGELPPEVRREMTSLDYSEAEDRCPRRLPIARLMHEAGTLLV
jgi:predicted aldo/keto reductase-like oxidoreductase